LDVSQYIRDCPKEVWGIQEAREVVMEIIQEMNAIHDSVVVCHF
jgi:hypothetical protein